MGADSERGFQEEKSKVLVMIVNIEFRMNLERCESMEHILRVIPRRI